MAATLEKVLAQARERLAGAMPDGATRVVSFQDKDARPIRKGWIGVPVEFGYKAQVVDNSDGLVLDYMVLQGNPADAPLLRPAIERARFGKAPRALTADRGYGEVKTEAELTGLGIKKVVIPPGQSLRRQAPSRVGQRLPQAGEVAHRGRGLYNGTKARLWLGPHADGRHCRCWHLVRLGHLCPQRHKARRPRPRCGQPITVTATGEHPFKRRSATGHRPADPVVNPLSLPSRALTPPKRPGTATRGAEGSGGQRAGGQRRA